MNRSEMFIADAAYLPMNEPIPNHRSGYDENG